MIRIYLSRLLGEKRWSQADLARQTGIRPTTISEMYHEFIPRITVEHLNKICAALECKLDELIEYVPDTKPITGKHLIVDEHGNRKQKTE